MRTLRTLLITAVLIAGASQSRAGDVSNVLPAETEQIVYFNFRQIIESDLMKKLAIDKIKESLKNQNAQKILGDLGLDPLKDLDKAVIGLWGKDPQNQDMIAVVYGRFDGDKLIAAAEKAAKDSGDKVSVTEEGGYKLLKVSGDNGKPFYASVADEKTVIGGTDAKMVATAIKSHINKAKPILNKNLAALTLKQDDKASMWFCTIMEGRLGDVNIPEIPLVDGKAIKAGLDNMRTMSATVQMGKDLNVVVSMGMKDADSADEFNVTLKKLLDLGKVFLPNLGKDNPNAAGLIDDVVNTLNTEVKEKDIQIKLKLTAEAMQKAMPNNDKDK